MLLVLLAAGIIIGASFSYFHSKEVNEPSVTDNSEIESLGYVESIFEVGTDFEQAEDESILGILESNYEKDDIPEAAKISVGIDVSSHQGNIDWTKAAASGVEFAMVRIGYRASESGEIKEDSSARYNMQEAAANGIMVGVYFFSTAVTAEEAIEEAEWTADFIAQYPITYPVVYDCENYDKEGSRQYQLTAEERTEIACVFMEHIREAGYTPMFYASKNELTDSTKWIISEIMKSYDIWLCWYTQEIYPDVERPEYSGSYSMWQYTNEGTVSGIKGAVDLNVAYFRFEEDEIAEPKDSTPAPIAEANVEAGHDFIEVNEKVTAKDVTNLRNMPSQGQESQIVAVLENGQAAVRTGMSSSGWSRISYQGMTLYAVSSLLTTDLDYKIQETATNSEEEIQTAFTPCDDMVSPKIEVNLRNIPSVTSENSKVETTAQYGEVFHRTGINEELGWSRVEYNGQILYCISSYIYVYENPQE